MHGKASQRQKLAILDSASQKNPALNSQAKFCFKLACDLGQVSVIFLRKFSFFIHNENRTVYLFLRYGVKKVLEPGAWTGGGSASGNTKSWSERRVAAAVPAGVDPSRVFWAASGDRLCSLHQAFCRSGGPELPQAR